MAIDDLCRELHLAIAAQRERVEANGEGWGSELARLVYENLDVAVGVWVAFYFEAEGSGPFAPDIFERLHEPKAPVQ